MQSFYDGFAGENRWFWTFGTPVVFGACFALLGYYLRLLSLENWRLTQECPPRPWIRRFICVQVVFAILLFFVNYLATTLTEALRQDNLGRLASGLLIAVLLVWGAYPIAERIFQKRTK